MSTVNFNTAIFSNHLGPESQNVVGVTCCIKHVHAYEFQSTLDHQNYKINVLNFWGRNNELYIAECIGHFVLYHLKNADVYLTDSRSVNQPLIGRYVLDAKLWPWQVTQHNPSNVEIGNKWQSYNVVWHILNRILFNQHYSGPEMLILDRLFNVKFARNVRLAATALCSAVNMMTA